MKQFEDMTIKEVRKLNEEFKKQNPEIQTAQEILNSLNKEK